MTSERDKIKRRFSEYFKELRKSRSLSMLQFSRLIRLGQTIIHYYEVGRSLPDYETAERVGEVLGERDKFLLMAGYVPRAYPIKKLISVLELNYFENLDQQE